MRQLAEQQRALRRTERAEDQLPGRIYEKKQVARTAAAPTTLSKKQSCLFLSFRQTTDLQRSDHSPHKPEIDMNLHLNPKLHDLWISNEFDWRN